MSERRYPCGSRPTKIVAPTLVLVGMSLLFFYFGITNKSGLRMKGASFSPEAASNIYLGVGVFFAALMLVLLLQWRRSRLGADCVVLDDEAISVPGPFWSPKLRRVPYAQIRAVSKRSAHGKTVLKVEHELGTFGIGSWIVGEQAFAEIESALRSRSR